MEAEETSKTWWDGTSTKENMERFGLSQDDAVLKKWDGTVEKIICVCVLIYP